MTTRILCFMATSSPVGGVATWLDRAAAELPRRGFEVTVALVRGLAFHDPARYRAYHPNLDSVEVDGRGLDREGRVRACLRIIRGVQPDLVLPLGVLDANEAAFRAKSGNHGPRVIGRAQGNLPPMLADLVDLRDGLDHVVCVGEMTRRFLVRHASYDPARVDHVPNGADTATTRHVPRTAGAPIRLGYIGRLMKNDKRVLDLPGFCRDLDARGTPFHLTVAGSGPCETELREQLATFGERVTLLGACTAADVYARVLPNLDALMLFSSSETFGIVLAEAMMNGVVPVTSRYTGFHAERLVVDGENGLSFPVGDLASAAEQVTRLANESGLLERLSAEALRRAEGRYTWQQCFDRWEDVFQRVLQRAPVQTAMRTRPVASGRLDRLGVPAGLTDAVRRWRRRLGGSPVPAGGEEWPLFRKDHAPQRLEEIKQQCAQLEAEAGNQP